jgi:hypothetical protein
MASIGDFSNVSGTMSYLSTALPLFTCSTLLRKKNAFAGWSEDRRRGIPSKLLDIIERRTKHGFASVVHQNDFDQVFSGANKQKDDSPYNLCCTCCHLQIGEWAQKTYQIEPIAFFFDAGHKNAGEVAKTFWETKADPK